MIRSHPPAAQHFIGALREIATWANAHHDESAPILAKYSKLPVRRSTRCTAVILR